jgi:starvation-inducible DNA-binding protein
MFVITSRLPEADRKVIAEALQAALVDLLDLSLTGKQVHWSLYGRCFALVCIVKSQVARLVCVGFAVLLLVAGG